MMFGLSVLDFLCVFFYSNRLDFYKLILLFDVLFELAFILLIFVICVILLLSSLLLLPSLLIFDLSSLYYIKSF